MFKLKIFQLSLVVSLLIQTSLSGSNELCGCENADQREKFQTLVNSQSKLGIVNLKVDNLFSQLTELSQNQEQEAEIEKVEQEYIVASKIASEQKEVVKADQEQAGASDSCDMDCVKYCINSNIPWNSCFSDCNCESEFNAQFEKWQSFPLDYIMNNHLHGSRFGRNLKIRGRGQALEMQRGMKFKFTSEPQEQKCCEEYLNQTNIVIDPHHNSTCENKTITVLVDKPCAVCPANITCEKCNITEPCPTCPPKEVCIECEKCPPGKECPAEKECEKCKECKVCDNCTTCQQCPPSIECPPKENCTSCEKCQNCTICDKCKTCPPEKVCPDTPACKECTECETCQICNGCPECPPGKECPITEECQKCEQCKECPGCPAEKICPPKENCTICEQCLTCPPDKICPETPECQKCQECRICEACQDCPKCPHVEVPITEECEKCEKCNECPNCPPKIDCPPKENCTTCQNCTQCPPEKICPQEKICEECKNCTACKECQDCKECKDCPAEKICNECPAEKICEQCKNCTECPAEKICDKCPDQITCEKCKEPTPCDKCPDPVTCPNCTACECDKCKDCPTCQTCEICKTCPDCPECQKCKDCQECEKCPEIKPCETCPPKENCTACEKCEACETCPDCAECIKCKECQECEKCPDVKPCETCPPKENCTACEKCEKCQLCVPIIKNQTVEVFLPCNETCDCRNVSVNASCPQCQLCKVCPEPTICPDCPIQPIPEPCPVPKACPNITCPPGKECPTVTCPSCITNITNFTTTIILRQNIYRIISTSISHFIIKTQYASLFQNISIYDIIKEIYFENNGHITVTLTTRNLTFFIQVTKVSGFDNVYETTYIINSIKYSYYVVIETQIDDTFITAILNPNDFKILEVFKTTLIWDITTLTGFRYKIEQSTVTTTITKIITIIIERFSKIIIIQRNLISAAQTGAMHTHLSTTNTSFVTQWRVSIIEFTQTVSTFLVTGHNQNETILVRYNVTVDENNEQINFFVVKIFITSTQSVTHNIIVYGVVGKPNSYYNVVIFGKEILAKYLTTITFKVTYWEVQWSRFEVVIPEITEIIEVTTVEKQTKVVYVQSNAAVSALVRWVLELKEKDVELETLQDTSTQSLTTIRMLNTTIKKGPWTVTTRLIKFEKDYNLYYCRFKYPSGNTVGYFVLITQTGPLTFESSVLFEGTSILVTYKIELQKTSQTNIFRIISITTIDRSKHVTAIEDLSDNVVVTDLSTIVNQTTSQILSNGTISGSFILTNKTVTETTQVIIRYKIYQHPTTGKSYHLYENNTVIDGETKQVVSQNGGLNWIMAQFNSAIQLVTENNYKVFTYTLTGEKWKIFTNGTVQTYSGIFVTQGGIDALLLLISQRGAQQFTTDISYRVYQIEGTPTKYKIYQNGTVTTYEGKYITNKGQQGLIEYLRRDISIYSTVNTNYRIATDKTTGTQYLIYADGRVTTVDGRFITAGGANGLAQYLLSTIVTTETTTTAPTVYGYRTVIYGDENFQLYPNQTVIKTSTKEVVTTKGMEGLKEWLIKRASQITSQRINYQVITDERTGNKYFLFENNTVTTDQGEIRCVLRGLECLKDLLHAQQNPNVQEIEIIKAHRVVKEYEMKVYIDKQGQNWLVGKNGRVFNPRTNKSEIEFNVDNFIKDMTFNRTQQLKTEIVEYLVQSYETKQQYLLYEDGSVFNSNSKFLTAGGFTGLIRFLTVQNLVVLTENKDEQKISVSEIERDWSYGSYFFKEDDGSIFCKSNSSADLNDCMYAYLSKYYLTRILQKKAAIDFELFVDGYDEDYIVYSSGLVTDENSYELFRTGVQGLYEYLDNYYQKANNNITFIYGAEKSEIYQTRYDQYINPDDNTIYHLFVNGSLFNTKTKKFLTKDEYKGVLNSLQFNQTGTVSERITYKPVRITGIDKESFEKENYQIRNDGSSWYKNQLFQAYGGEKGLKKFLEVKKNLRHKYGSLEITVPQIEEKFSYLYDPERFINKEGEEICRSLTWDDIFECLTRYLVDNHYEKLIYVKPVGNFTAFTLPDGSQYIIYANGTVTTAQGIFVTLGGMQGFIDYRLNLEKDVYLVKKVFENFTEEVRIYTDSKQTKQEFLRFDNASMYNVTGKSWVQGNSFEAIKRGEFVFKEFRNNTSLIEISYYQDRLTNNTYKILADKKVYHMNNTYINTDGYKGLVFYIQIEKIIKGVYTKDTKGDGTLVFTAYNLTYDVIKANNLYTLIEKSEKRIASLPRKNLQEIFNLAYYDLFRSGKYLVSYELIPEFDIVTDSQGKQYMILHFGIIVTHDKELKYICTGFDQKCLENYLKKEKLTLAPQTKENHFHVYWATDGLKYLIDDEEEVYTYPKGSKSLGKDGFGETYLLEYLKYNGAPPKDSVKVTYALYIFNGISYHVFSDGKVTDIHKKEICDKGGLECLKLYLSKVTTIKSNSTAYQLYYGSTDKNTLYRVYISGSVTFDSNNTNICVTGGVKCLTDWLLKRQKIEYYSIVQLDDGRKYYVSESGRVTQESDNREICATGGVPCLKLYLEANTPSTVSAAGQLFYVYKNGTVKFISGEILCLSGGQSCINKYLTDQSYTIFTYNNIRFKVFGSGKVIEEVSQIQICLTGGSECLQNYINSQRYQIITSGTQTFRFFASNDSVIQEGTWKTICTTGGVPCLKDYLSPKYSIASFAGINYRIHQSGKVETDQGVQICQTGGQVCLTNYIKSITPSPVDATLHGQKVVFYVFQNGTVTFRNGTMVSRTGGIQALKQYIIDQSAQIVPFSILNKNYQVRAYADGRIINVADNSVICATGGVKCLEEWIRVNTPQSIIFKNITYYMYVNGTVTDSKLKVICKTGGQTCLQNYLATFTPTVNTVTLNGVNYDFHVYKNGTVFYAKTGELVSKTGGAAAIENWLLDRTPQDLTVTVGTQKLVFKVYKSGRVLDSKGNVICETGGEQCVKTYLENQMPTVMTYTINKVDYLFDMYKNGTVVDQKTKKVVCKAGSSSKCLDDYAQQLMKATALTPTKLIWLQAIVSEMVGINTWLVAIVSIMIISLAFSLYLRKTYLSQNMKIDKEEIAQVRQQLGESLIEKRQEIV